MELIIAALLLYIAIEEAMGQLIAQRERELKLKYPNYILKNKPWWRFY